MYHNISAVDMEEISEDICRREDLYGSDSCMSSHTDVRGGSAGVTVKHKPDKETRYL